MRVRMMAVGLSIAWASQQAGMAATESSTANIKVIANIPGGDGYWDYAAFDVAQRRLFVGREDGVMALDVDTRKVIDRLVPGQRVHSIVLLPKGRALSTNGLSNTATLFDRASGKILAQIPTGKKPDSALFDPVSGFVLVMDGDDQDTTLIDPDAAKAVARIPVGGSPESAATDGTGRVFVNLSDHSEMAVIDIAARKVAARYPLPDCMDASGLALNAKAGVIVSTCANLKALAISAADGHLLATLPIAKYPDAIVFDPIRELIYIPCALPGTLVVVAVHRGSTPAVVANIPIAMGAHTLAIDADGGRLYIPAGEFGPPTSAGGRPSLVAGTFKIQVLALER
jgi:DNA-binding beta-propeller fold protein YncE